MESNTINYDDMIIRDSPYSTALINIKPQNRIIFSDGNTNIGELSWEDGEMTFSGNAEPSAKIFFDYISHFFEDRE